MCQLKGIYQTTQEFISVFNSYCSKIKIQMFQQKSQISVNAEIETNRIGKILSLFKH